MNTKNKKSKATPKYSWGGVLADTAVGAGTGALLGGPVGAVIGGAGAFLKGALGEVQGNREEQLKLSQQKVANATSSFNTMMGGGNQNPFTQMMAKGGMVSMNAEIEKGETAVSPDGRMREFSLPSHANTTGDNFKYFDPGTMIFSDKLKFSKNKTFAQEQLSYKKISDKAEKALKNPGSTFLNKKTAGLNKQNSLKMSYDLFGKQEAMKMSKGGSVPGKYPDGGGVPRLPYDGYTSTGAPYPSQENTLAAMMYPYNMGAQGHPINMPQINVNGNAAMAGVPNSMNNPINLPEQFVSANRTNLQYPMQLPQPGMQANQYAGSPAVAQAPSGYTGFPMQQNMMQGMQANQYAGWRMPGVRDARKGYTGFPMQQNMMNRMTGAQQDTIYKGAQIPEVGVTAKRGGTGTGTGKVNPTNDINRWLDNVVDIGYDKMQPPTNPSMRPAAYNPTQLAAVAPNNPTQEQTAAHLTQFGDPSKKPDWGGIGMQALALAPDIYNLGHALFSKPEKVERNRYFNPYTNQIRSRMNDRRFNIDPILAGNRTANAVYNRNAASASGGDRSRLLSNLMGGLNARYGADANAYAQKNNMDNQYRGEQAEMDMNLGNMNARGLMMSDDINARNMAAKRNFGASAASGLQSYALNQMQMQNQMNSQSAYLDVLERINPYNNQWMDIDSLRARNKKYNYGKN